MIALTSRNIELGVRAHNKEDAIREAGRVLVEAGNIAPAYVESMLGREEQATTFLGNGIAIPHGMQKDREFIFQTGVSIVQVPGGVEWNPGQVVYLVIGIAAKSDEHLSVLAALTDVLDEPATARRLAATHDCAEIITALNRTDTAPVASSGPAPTGLNGSRYVDAVLGAPAGLHARPATVFVDLAGRFASEIRVDYQGKTANGKAMGSLLRLAVGGGATLRIVATGPDADEALLALRQAVESGLGDVVEKTAAAVAVPGWVPESSGRSIGGVGASPGLAIGRLHHFQVSRILVEDTPGKPETERLRLRQALEVARAQLQEVYDTMSQRSGKAEAAIFKAHQAFLADSELEAAVEALINDGHSAAWAWQSLISERVHEMRSLENEHLAARAADLHDAGQRVLRVLAGAHLGEVQLPDEPVILVADDLTPSDTARLDPQRILGLCTVSGGPTSHTAIIARSLDIPAVVGTGAAVLELTEGITCILDGTSGHLYMEPSATELESARRFQQDLRLRREEEYFTRYQPAILTDGHRVEVVANIGKASEAAPAVEAGAEGVGLLRTEFLFLGRDTPPSEEEQFEAYTTMTRALNGLPLIIRTLDIGGDKVIPYLPQPKEENPFLGVRGIRLCLRKPELFIPQLRAIYRASLSGPVRMMFPMVSSLEELRDARAMAEQVQMELGVAPIEIGIMVEVPSAVIMAAELARQCDFFSIGTNDLTQYVLAMDRMHPALARQVDGLHPAVLRLIDQTVRAAQNAGKWVGVCGGIAGEPLGATILTGLGVNELSMSVPSVAAIKAHLRGLSLVQARTLAAAALACSTAEQVRALKIQP